MDRGTLMCYSPWGHKELDMTEATEHIRMHGFKLNIHASPPIPIHILIINPQCHGVWRCSL